LENSSQNAPIAGEQGPLIKAGSTSLLNWPNLLTWQRVGLIVIAVILASEIALQTRFDAHPDEYLHQDAFQYFEDKWWPPDLGSDEVVYSKWGNSRVYDAEIVYLIYGKFGKVLMFIRDPGGEIESERTSLLAHRLLNVGLFLVTLTALFFVKSKSINPALIGLTFLIIPQVYYVYSYANSDAWGISMGVFLFLLVIKMFEKTVSEWSWFEIGLLGFLTGLLILSKLPFLISLLLPYSLITVRLFQELIQKKIHFSWLFYRFIVWGSIIVFMTTPLKIIYPNTQGDYHLKKREMIGEKAANGYQPDMTKSLAEQGEAYLDLIRNHPFLDWSLKSFYGVFGYFSDWNPPWVYFLVGILILTSIILTAIGVISKWKQISESTKIILILSPLIILLNFIASMYNSYYRVFSPQGRYIFASLIPFSLLFLGNIFNERGRIKHLRLAIYVVLYLLCIFSIVFIILRSPTLHI
jgi:hypothetical protein